MGSKLHLDDAWVNVNDIDVNHMIYGNFIGVQYVFRDRLNEAVLNKAWRHIRHRFPKLASQFDNKTRGLKPYDGQIFESSDTDMSLQDFLKAEDPDRFRSKFITEPNRRYIQNGRKGLSYLKLTNFSSGGCVLGLAINHLISDGSGVHKLAHELADIYTALREGSDVEDSQLVSSLPEFTFGTENGWLETQSELKRQNLKTPMSLSGIHGFLFRQVTNWAMDKIIAQKRLRIHFSPEQVLSLKETTLRESDEDWISTNMALCAHFTSIMIALVQNDNPHKNIRLGQLLDLRNRYCKDKDNKQSDFIGNAILIHTETPNMTDYSRGSLARFFKSFVGDLTPDSMRNRMDLVADCLRHGRNYPGLEMSDLLLAVNNQTKMSVYDIEFSEQKPIQIIPQDVGDTIMFFPASDGGVDVYLRDLFKPKRQAKLETQVWQSRIYDF